MNTQFETKTNKMDWITPPNLITELGYFDLDPCASELQSGFYAETNWTIKDNGLNKDWFGRVWCNPPYGNKAEAFIKKLANHGNGIALIFNRMDTKLWQETILNTADAIFIIKGRLKFFEFNYDMGRLEEGGSAGCGSCLVIYGKDNIKAVANTTLKGHFLFTHRMIEDNKEEFTLN